MYTIYADGNLLFSSGTDDERFIILSPRLSLDVNGAGSLTFVMPPCNQMYDSIRRIKSIITVKQDDDIIFRGRVLDDEKDIYNQKDVYCEGERCFLLDSLKKPYTYDGKIRDFFKALIQNHNDQVEEEKQFTVGIITAVTEDATMEAENTSYSDTLGVIEDTLLGAYGGYIRTRTESDVHYIDWLETSGDTNEQTIEFSVNLLDLKDKVDAADVFTCLIPLGESRIDDDGNYTDPVSVKSVNDGKEYIQDDDAVKLYGKIWRTKTWNDEDSPEKLLEKGREYLNTGIAVQTITLNAIDMHFTDSSVQRIFIGDHVRILSDPHGIDISIICSKMDIDLIDPENTTYTFGERPRTLSESVIRSEKETNTLSGNRGGGGGGGKSIQEEVAEILRWARIRVDEANASINLNAGEIDKTQQYMSAAGIDINGALANVKILATKETVDTLEDRVDSAEASIEVNADNIELKVSKNGVISAINQTAESITISASKINLEGLVSAGFITSENLASKIAALDYINAAAMKVTSIDAGNAAIGTLSATSFTVDGKKASWKSKDVLVDITRKQRYAMAPSGETSISFYEVTGETTETIYYLGRSGD
jgi:hypothetical protein